MKSVRRKILRLVSVASLLLCGAAVALWVRSEGCTDWVWYETAWHRFDVASERGRLMIGGRVGGERFEAIAERRRLVQEHDSPGYRALIERPPRSADFVAEMIEALDRRLEHWRPLSLHEHDRRLGALVPELGSWRTGGLRTVRYQDDGNTADLGFWVVVPHAWVVLLAAVTPGWWIGQWVRRMRHRASGACGVCGYDLTGNTSGICSECGTAVGRASAVRAE